MEKTIGFIGAGNMASAIIGGMLSQKVTAPENISVFDLSAEKCSAMVQKGLKAASNIHDLVEQSDMVFLAVKPQNYAEVLAEAAPAMTAEKLVVTIAAGISSDYIQKAVGFPCKVVRAMPNTPLLLGEGATALCQCPPATDREFALVRRIFEAAGVVEVLPESLMNEVIAVNGSSPAYVYLFAKAVMDSAAKTGIPAEQAKKLFVQTLIGSAKMLTDSGMEPQQLIDMVSSKGGTTIAALERFRAHGFEEMVDDAMSACTRRALELGK